MASLDLTSFDASLKYLYTEDIVEDLVYKNNPFFAMVKKNSNVGGKSYVVPVVYGHGQGRSAAFATAQTNASAGLIDDFVITFTRNYGVCTIDNLTIQASKGNKKAFMEATKFQIDSTLKNVGRDISRSLFGDGSGAIGQVNNGSYATTNLDLVLDDDVVNFEKDMIITVSADKTSAVRSGTLTVSSVNRTATSNQVVTSANLSTGISAIAQNDYIFVQGDYGAKMSGLGAWIPVTAPTATTFFGVNRSTDATRLGGLRYVGTGKTKEEALIDAEALLSREDGAPDVCFMNPLDLKDLKKELGSRVSTEPQKVGSFSFEAVMMHGTNGMIKVIAERNCPRGYAYLITLDSWELISVGEPVAKFDEDGLTSLRQATSDGIEIRITSYCQLACHAPGWNAVITL